MTTGVTDLFREPRYDAPTVQPKRPEPAKDPEGCFFVPGHWYFASTDLCKPVKQLRIFRVDEVGSHAYKDHRRAFGQLLFIVLGVLDRPGPEWEAHYEQERDFPYWVDITTAAGIDVVTALSAVTT